MVSAESLNLIIIPGVAASIRNFRVSSALVKPSGVKLVGSKCPAKLVWRAGQLRRTAMYIL